MQKSIGVITIVDPTEVKAIISASGDTYDVGAIFVSIPEQDIVGESDIYCQSGLGVGYKRLKVGDEVWVEPTVNGEDRWVYTGLVDGGGSTDPAADEVFIDILPAGKFIIQVGDDITIEGDSTSKLLDMTCGGSTIEMTDTKVTINKNLEVDV